jgi:hypothetical protein
MKTRIAALIGLVVVIVLVVGIGGYWYVKDHQRISQASLQSKVVSKTGGKSATCVKKDSNAAHWLCAVTGQTKAAERCVKAHVRPWGSVNVVNGYRKCLADPTLKVLFVTEKKTKKKKKSGSSA